MDFWDLEKMRQLPEVKSGTRRVTVCVGKGELVDGDAVEGARGYSGEVMRYLERFVKEGTRMFVRVDEVAVRLLVKGDLRLEILRGWWGMRV
jgi:hypothetical protein